jgi:hypothetical protein
MSRVHLLLAFSTIAGTAAALPASDCDCQKPAKSAPCNCIQDDRGLLDVVDSVAGRIHSGLRSSLTNIGRLPGKMQPSSCGCEVKTNSCGCHTCQSGGNKHQSVSESSVAPPMAKQGHSSVSEDDQPAGLRVLHPMPDAKVNPFDDEPAQTGQNRVRGRTIQYRSNGNTNRPNANSSRSQRAPYGQQYNPQAQRIPTTADYWAESEQQRPLQLVAPASNETPSLEEVFRPAYRISIKDSDDQPGKTLKSQSIGLRPVPTHNPESVSSRIQLNVDAYERESSNEQPVYDNPLRR